MFECIRLDQKDSYGTLAANGVDWTEGTRGLSIVLGWFLLGMTVVGLILIWDWRRIWPEYPGLSLLAGVVALSSWSWPSRFDLPRLLIRKSLRFFRDGRMEGPSRALVNGEWCKMAGDHAGIVSIETRMSPPKPVGKDEHPAPPSYEIVVFMRDGDTWVVGGDLRQDEAHKVTVELTNALARMRESQAAGPRVRVGRMATARLVN